VGCPAFCRGIGCEFVSVCTLAQDIVAMVYSADRLSWYENSGANGNKSSLFDWSGAEHQIDVRLSGVRDLVLEDLNRDGHLDLAKVCMVHTWWDSLSGCHCSVEVCPALYVSYVCRRRTSITASHTTCRR
jgi:hypothetical protein